MYAIVTTGGKQYKVAKGDTIEVEKLDVEPGGKVELDVVMLNDGKKLVASASELASTKVGAKVVEHFKGEKQLVFKFKKRKRYQRLKGHRQQLTRLEISDIPGAKKSAAKKSTKKAEETAEAAE